MIISSYLDSQNITRGDVRAICNLKMQSWPHSISSQLKWWDDNTDLDDVFVILAREGTILAFLRLRTRSLVTNDVWLDALCVTEVCVHEQYRRQGLGTQLMDAASSYIKNTYTGVAYLLCSDTQESFYSSCGWRLACTLLRINSLTGQGTRALAKHERCMIFDPQDRLIGPVILFGDVF